MLEGRIIFFSKNLHHFKTKQKHPNKTIEFNLQMSGTYSEDINVREKCTWQQSCRISFHYVFFQLILYFSSLNV